MREIGELDLGLVARRTAPLEDLYAETASSLNVSIEIVDGRPTRWALGGNSHTSASELNRHLRDLDAETVAELTHAVIERIERSRNADLHNPYSRPAIETPLWADGVKRSAFTLSLMACVGLFQRLVVTGPPGAGKSMFAKHLAIAVAKAQGDDVRGGEGSHVDLWRPRPGIPLFAELRPFVTAAAWPDVGTSGITSDSLVTYVTSRYLRKETADARHEFARKLIDLTPIFILDGIDEIRIPDTRDGALERRRQVEYLVKSLHQEYPGCRIVLTARDYSYTDWVIPDFTHVYVGPFEDERVADLVRRLLTHAADASVADVDTHVTSIVDRVRQLVPEDLRWRPLFLSLLAGVYARRISAGDPGLPGSLNELLEESVTLMLDRWAANGTEENLLIALGCDVDKLRERVDAIAYAAQEYDASEGRDSSDASRGFPDTILLKELVQLPGKINYHELLGYLQRDTGLILSPSDGRCVFAHRSFQEYLAAHHIFRSGVDGSPWASIGRNIAVAPMVWREPLQMLGALLVESNRIGEIWGLVDSLLGGTADPDLAEGDLQRWWLLWLATSYVEAVLANSSSQSRIGRLVTTDLVKTIESLPDPQLALPHFERNQLRTTVGKLRKLIGSYPPAEAVEWCEIPEGEFWMGLAAQEADDFAANEGRGIWLPGREVPGTSIYLPRYLIARYLVTRAEFAEFVLAPDGYYSDENWLDEHRVFRHPEVLNVLTDPIGATSPVAPRSEVTWYEALAYAAWLSRRLGMAVGLPTEAQWEKAARGLDRRIFPWGQRFLFGRCNSAEAGFNDVSAVGVFAPTEGYWGVDSPADMAGNLWEWCTTICEFEVAPDLAGTHEVFGYPYAADEREDLLRDREWMRVVRGGSYLSPPHHLMTTFRGRDCPDIRLYRHGFRVVAT